MNNIEIRALTRGRLKALNEEDSGYIYNQFAEILRHNVVSDKPNAFNKIFNLFLCKIVDEDKADDEVLGFQWLELDDDESLQKRLNDLYKFGMQEYLKKEVTDYSDKEIDELLTASRIFDNKDREKFKQVITEIRLYKNNEFAFIEVFNEKSFRENARIVKEIIGLLQPYQIRYTHKQQFLSNFFELLLSNSLKQEAGQFFTPVPIAKFIISSIPLKKIVERKIAERKTEFLPYIIDFAAGSGHFLTEAMDELHHIIEQLPAEEYRSSVKSKLEAWRQFQPYEWARDYIYGIEKDYRLVKTAKVSCFLNGDGLANVTHADGLDSFADSADYQELLKQATSNDQKECQNFDVLVANPPYSVSAFIKTLPKGRDSFDLYDRFTEQSSEIECLFIERMKQLLKDGGYAGIILPSSILSNAGIYTDAREIILKHFKIVAIVEFGTKTFMATGTSTITMFLQRRNNLEWVQVKNTIDKFFVDRQDTVCNGIENAFATYVNYVYQDISLDDYISFIAQDPNEKFQATELYREYAKWYDNLSETKNLKKKIDEQKAKWAKRRDEKADAERIKPMQTELEKLESDFERLFYEKAFALEQEKMLYFFLAYPQQVVLVKAGKKEQEKTFLGYEFSNRRGHEGIKLFKDAQGNFATKLYHDTNRHDETKASSYIYRTFLGEPITTIHSNLAEHVQVANLHEMMTFDRVEFEKTISLAGKKKANTEIQSKWELVRLSEVIELISGQSPEGQFYNSIGEGLPFYQGKLEFGENYLKEPQTWTSQVTKEAFKNDILMCVRAPVGPVNLNPFDKICIGRGLSALRTQNNDKLNQLYLYYFLKFNQHLITGRSGAIFNSISRNEILSIKIPLPPKEVQEQIAQEMKRIESQEKSGKERINQLKSEIERIVDETFQNQNTMHIELGKICDIKGGKRVPKGTRFSETKTEYPYIRVTDFKNHSVDLSGLKYITQETFEKISNYTISIHDVYLSIAGTIGLVGTIPTELDGKSLTENAAKIVIKDRQVLDKKFLGYCLSSSFGQAQINERIKQLGVPKLALKRIETIKIPLPPLLEQQKIITNLGNLENEISEIETKLADLALAKCCDCANVCAAINTSS